MQRQGEKAEGVWCGCSSHVPILHLMHPHHHQGSRPPPAQPPSPLLQPHILLHLLHRGQSQLALQHLDQPQGLEWEREEDAW